MSLVAAARAASAPAVTTRPRAARARVPGEPRGGRALERRRRVSLVRAGVGAAVRGIDAERLEGEAAVVAVPPLAPWGRDLVLVAGPRAGGGEPGAGARPPLRLAGGL